MARLSDATPFILLDDARAAGAAPARLYRNPIRIIEARRLEDVVPALDALKTCGLHAAGFLSYEAGFAFEPKLGVPRLPTTPLLWFGLFERFDEIAPEDVAALLPDPAAGWAGAPRPGIARADYDATLAHVKSLIAAGDIYQANLTIRAEVLTAGHPLALYAGLRRRAQAGYGGIVWTGADWLLSLSPELFFAAKDGKATTRPMKGTAARMADPRADLAAIARLRSDPKQRAENLMIVDLLRNDLSRVAAPGSVVVPSLFAVESYPTVHQMTSTVTAQLASEVDAVETVKALFPCGSITGAPKIRAMEVIGAIEATARGVYTGSIGRIDPSGDAAFNVAIRTLHLPSGESRATLGPATLGLGGGIVADSEAGDEWRECLAKGAFVASEVQFDLIETMRFDPAGGIHLLDRHIARIGDSARTFGFPFDRHAARNELQAATFRIASPRRVRLMLSPSGRIAFEIGLLAPIPETPVKVALAPLPVSPDDYRLSHKTSDRAFYAEARARASTFEIALVDAAGFITEGSFTNIFVKGDGTLLTPPLSRGLLPGVLRAELLANGSAVEADLRAEDLAAGFFVGNASRGLIEAVLA
jgi:para-aminobenzoate synthetase/4-amino-4-deoxychorismate lyase